MTQRLFGRQVIIQIGQPGKEGLSWSDLRTDFQVDYKAGERGTAAIEVYNIGQAGLAEAQRRGAIVRLFAGYDTPKKIFTGCPVRKNGVIYTRNVPDTILRLTCKDGGQTWSNARINLTFEEQVSLDEAVSEVIKALGIPRGSIRVPEQLLPAGTILKGRAEEVLRTLLPNENIEFTILDGKLQIASKDTPAGTPGPLFSSRTGNLIGSPVRKDRNTIEITTLMEGVMRPGRRFGVESLTPDGTLTTAAYRAKSVSFNGSRWENDFYTRIVGRSIA